MLQRARIRTLVWAFFGVSLLSGAAVGVYGFVRLVPAARSVHTDAETLRLLFEKISIQQRSVGSAIALAGQAAERGDASLVRRLRDALPGRESVFSSVPLEGAPTEIRVAVASAVGVSTQIVLLLDEIVSHLELGERAEARARLPGLLQLERRLDEALDEARTHGLGYLAATQARTILLTSELLRVYAAWLVLTLVLVGVGIALFDRRLARPLGVLREGLRRVEEGDLTVALSAPAQDEMGELAEHFNRVTQVLRDRAERQGQIAAAGELLAGAAHEVNNPLMAISALAENRSMDASAPPHVRADMTQIVEEARRAGQLLKAIVSFLRPHQGGRSAEDFNAIVQDTWNLIWPQLRSDGVVGRLDLAPGLPPVSCERHQIQQALVNLLGNAHQALARNDPAQRRIDVRTALEGDRVTAVIHDIGPGVAPALREQLFRPFFSTRSSERVGLGLYTSRLIARAHGGDVAFLDSAAGGATFALSLPAAERPAAVAADPGAGRRESLHGVRILVVDDEPTVRRPIARYLTRRGAQVREAADGREALGVALDGSVDLILTDLRMPVMDGVSLYKELLKRAPALARRVLFLSGDVHQIQELGAEAIEPGRVLTKPLELAELEARLLAHRA